MSEPLSSERAVRLLRAKVGELEQAVLDDQELHGPPMRPVVALTADIALVAGLLADEIERRERRENER